MKRNSKAEWEYTLVGGRYW